MAERIQLRRTKGWRLPPGAVSVARPTCWGNPFKAGEAVPDDSPLFPYLESQWKTRYGDDPAGWRVTSITPLRAEDVVAAYSWWIIEQPHLMLRMVEDLGGRDLACWCKLPAEGEPDHCHAANLLELVAELEAGDD